MSVFWLLWPPVGVSSTQHTRRGFTLDRGFRSKQRSDDSKRMYRMQHVSMLCVLDRTRLKIVT